MIEMWVSLKRQFRLHTYKSNGWTFSKIRREMFVQEYPQWKQFYLPFSLRGLTVLDIGAGEGETARFFLENHAKRIVCIESDQKSFEYLLRNAQNWPMECYNKKFDFDDLELGFDFMKMDIEGYEEQLLTVQLEKPSVIEVHGLQLRDKFRKAGYVIKDVGHDDRSCTSYAFWMLYDELKEVKK